MWKGRESSSSSGNSRRRRRISSNSSSNDTTRPHPHLPSSSSSSSSSASWLAAGLKRNPGTDLSLNWSRDEDHTPAHHQMDVDGCQEEGDESDFGATTFYVKVYMEGIPIGRKLDLLAHDGFHELVTTVDSMFNTSIIWSEMDEAQSEGCHVLTYEDKEGDWLMVGDVPWEVFLSSVRRLKITRIC
ncbi:hypothetical protein MLD38_019915 [Melastoma candidum]|uniref:Uncharacterized protein n=1 Tax=Melastoma candidum TaxID=119954 RepID=A0ACB9QAX1_9MYRT|nr:hypothetical protein MLD38_019915 [Melastoma candidum]